MASLGRRGMTLLEMMMALTVFTLVMTSAMAFVRAQAKGFTVGADRMAVVQNMRYAADVWGKDLRTVGSNVPDQQPFLIYAGANVVAFNADYTTNVADDPFAVYYDPDAPNGLVTALDKPDRNVISGGTGFYYPDTTYKNPYSGTSSPAETITFFFALDTTTARTDDYVLYRQVNFGTSSVVARNLLQTPGKNFFQYYKLVTPANAPQKNDTIPAASLPLRHTIPIHLAPTDTGPVAKIDSIRGARLSFTATNGLTGTSERTRAITRLVWMPNAGLANKKTCGDEPIFGSGAYTVAPIMVGSDHGMQMTWAPATDENAGEKDVARYVIWRKVNGTVDWGDPYESVPAGLANYVYQDMVVDSAVTYVYGLAAQDCSPRLSALRQSAAVTPWPAGVP